jgi:hypothetical protein
MMRKLLVAGCISTALVLGNAESAAAGGAVWKFDRASYLPGDRAVAHTTVSWFHNAALGTPEDGPYFAYLVAAATEWVFPQIPPDARGVGEIQVVSEGLANPATIEFTVPDLAYGMYNVVHCNAPCTTTLGDLTDGELWVGVTPPPEPVAPIPEPAPAEEVEPERLPTRAASLSEPAPDDGGDTWRTWIVPTVLALLVAAGAVLLLRRRWPGPSA